MRPAKPMLLALLTLSLACSGGSSGGGVLGVTASFEPETPNPTDETTSMAEESATGNTVIVQVNVTGTDGLASAALDVTFPDGVEYVGYEAGDLFETLTGPTPPIYQASLQSGRLVLGIISMGGEADVAGTLTLIRLEFRVTQEGSFELDFDQMTLNDDQVQPILGITWSGGTLEGS